MFWGFVMMVVGALMFLGARMQSNFVGYRLIAARAQLLWGDKADTFLQVSGILVVLAGILVATLS